jgi:predicted nuclease of restriction endonuclease-like (RecB) superfamily
MQTDSKSSNSLNLNDYNHFLSDVKQVIQNARIKASYQVNKELLNLYQSIGQHIVERQKKFDWGKSVVEKLSKDLKESYPNTKGYSTPNLWFMRQFYLEYRSNANLLQLVREIPWGHNILVMTKLKNMDEREFYIRSTIEMKWSRNVLLNQIKSDLFSRQRVMPKQNNFDRALPVHIAEQADEAMKDVYTLDFLGIRKPILEKELEQRLIEKLKYFLLELGYGFSFIGNQYKVSVGNKDYFIDLLFYHRRLKCLVAIELKSGNYKPEYAGKMNFYLNLLDEHVREPDENHSVGIILCADRDHIEVEYSLKGIQSPVGVAEYQLTKDLPSKFQKELPNAKDLEKNILDELNSPVQESE